MYFQYIPSKYPNVIAVVSSYTYIVKIQGSTFLLKSLRCDGGEGGAKLIYCYEA